MKRHSIGKRFRKIKALKKADPQAIVPEAPEQLSQYISQLTSKYAICQTKNGLRYPGLIGISKLYQHRNQQWQKKLLFLFQQNYYQQLDMHLNLHQRKFLWITYNCLALPQREDYQFLAFLLYEYQRGAESK